MMREHSSIELGERRLAGDLYVVKGSRGLVIVVHGENSSRHSRRNLRVAQTLQRHQISTLLFDFFTPEEAVAPGHRLDSAALADRLLEIIEALPAALERPRIGLYGASAGTDVALHVAARRPEAVHAIVSRGGQLRVDHSVLHAVKAPTLLIAGGADAEVMRRNRDAHLQLGGEKRFEVIARATHLFQEAGALETVSRLAADWFETHLRPRGEATVQ